ncbi:mitochondrial fission ELM1 family protein [Thalassospira sp. TSL5-1]|uniref:mitochondrial fission ELM1 family protein n=1 Tax=Thalassospira sp. TSL5-1 TaxID=1544451 RepID=UPI000939CA7C|nr:mitochondrial fission ELM1 family protein [Thalassospira sp. TSL5-1]OKH89460.1 nucleoside-diphosphate sugar epimerase [Thalassospira sp. TSL5-1]
MTDTGKNRIWVLADDRAGNVNQAIGVAEAMACPFERIDIAYGISARLPNFVRRASLMGVAPRSRDRLHAPWPDLVIAAGRRTAPVARWIKKQSGGKSRLCQIMRPDGGEGDFDLIAVPAHDGVAPAKNVLTIPGAPHRISEARLVLEGNAWRQRFKDMPQPRIALIIGGSTKKTQFTAEMAREVTQMALHAAGQSGGSLLVTTSRRTGQANESLIADYLEQADIPFHLHGWNSTGENPYFGYLALADILIVTGDSVSMCCEACAAPGGVYIYAPDGIAAPRHCRLHQTLLDRGYARLLAYGEVAGKAQMPDQIEAFAHPSLQPARLVAQRCLALIGE